MAGHDTTQPWYPCISSLTIIEPPTSELYMCNNECYWSYIYISIILSSTHTQLYNAILVCLLFSNNELMNTGSYKFKSPHKLWIHTSTTPTRIRTWWRRSLYFNSSRPLSCTKSLLFHRTRLLSPYHNVYAMCIRLLIS